jgi:hypothetical protein
MSIIGLIMLHFRSLADRQGGFRVFGLNTVESLALLRCRELYFFFEWSPSIFKVGKRVERRNGPEEPTWRTVKRLSTAALPYSWAAVSGTLFVTDLLSRVTR